MQESPPLRAARPGRVALRIDDIGASTKVYEQYSNRWRGIGNFWKLKTLPYFRAWGPYPEMTPKHWEETFRLLAEFRAKITVGVTASWVEADGRRTAFPVKFPTQAALLREGQRAGLVEIANHGLTHCVLENKAFLPRTFTGNRKAHREFWEWLPAETHFAHVAESQSILQEYFQVPVVTLIPPGNVFAPVTLAAAQKHGITTVNCDLKGRNPPPAPPGIRVFGNEEVIAFHDRELVLFGLEWLRNRLRECPSPVSYRFVKDL